MRIKARNFPHPVLNPVTDDFEDSVFKAEIKDQIIKESIIEFKINFILENADLEKLILSNQAAYVIHLECPSTMQRITFTEYEKETSINIPLEQLNKKVDINYLILAENEIKSYENSNAHSDYSGISFQIKKGDILAFGQSQTIHIEKQSISNTNSIFKVSKSPVASANTFNVFITADQIDIELPKEIFEKIGTLQSFGEDSNKILLTMIYLPALIDTLFKIQEISQEEFGLDPYISLDWYRTLEKKLTSKKYDIANLDTDKITSICFDLLFSEEDHPVNSLENLIFNKEGEDNENDF